MFYKKRTTVTTFDDSNSCQRTKNEGENDERFKIEQQ